MAAAVRRPAMRPSARTCASTASPYQVIGVLPAGFHFIDADVDLWMPLSFTAEQRSDDARHSNSWTMVGRLKPGASVDAGAAADRCAERAKPRSLRQHEADPGERRLPHRRRAAAGRHGAARSSRTLYLLWGGVLFVLAIGAVNITNLVLIRSTARMRELATRHALGAGLARLTRQLLTETVLLTLAGGVAGAALGYLGPGAAVAASASSRCRAAPRSGSTASVVAFTMPLALAVGVLVGLVPVAEPAADESEPGLPRGRAQRHQRPRRQGRCAACSSPARWPSRSCC